MKCIAYKQHAADERHNCSMKNINFNTITSSQLYIDSTIYSYFAIGLFGCTFNILLAEGHLSEDRLRLTLAAKYDMFLRTDYEADSMSTVSRDET